MTGRETTNIINSSVFGFKLKPRFPKVRRKIQRTFLALLEGNHDRFKIPLHFVRWEDDLLEMGIAKLC